MIRNAILLISTLAVLLLLFAGYTSLVGSPGRSDDRTTAAGVALPVITQVADEKKLRIDTAAGLVELNPGERMVYVEYDHQGCPIRRSSWESWEKVPGTKDRLAVTKPELMLRLPNGMIVTVTAARGQITVDRQSSRTMQAKLGWIEGSARIVLDRETSFDRTPLSTRPQDQITIEMERLEFDLELGELKTSEPLRVTGAEFEIAGTGLHLIWNQSDNRVEKLLIENGGRMVLRSELLTSLDGSLGEQVGTGDPPAVTQPTRLAGPPPANRKRRLAAYRCAFTGGVTVDHYVDQRRVGGLQADELALLFDVGGGGRGLPTRDKAPASAPTSQPGESAEKRIVVRWSGQLALGPAKNPPAAEQPRRRIVARGDPLVVELPNGTVQCSRLVLHEESKRLWLYPAQNELVMLSSANRLSIRAATMFVDLDSSIVKLIGAVLFESRRGAGRNSQPLTIRCNLWAELHLGAAREGQRVEGVFDNPLASRPPESAVFVGDVEVAYEAQRIRSHRLDVRFCPAEQNVRSDPPVETAAVPDHPESTARPSALQVLLESAVATGDVRLTVIDPSARRGWRHSLERTARVLERALVRSLSNGEREKGRGRTRHEDRTLECATLRLDFGLTDGELHVRQMQGTGAVTMFDRHSRFAARGQRVLATFADRGELQQATVSGTETAPALVRARAYALRGKNINVDNQVRTLHVAGPSRLAFRSRHSLQGLMRSRAELITVTSSESLHVDDQRNTVHFIGQVAAGTGNEQLLADALTLLLEDVEVDRPPTVWSQLTGLVRAIRAKLVGQSQPAKAPRSFVVTTRSRSGQRKDLARVLASNAEIRRVVLASDDLGPLVYQSIAGPELEIDIRRRFLRTSGETTLLVTDRRLRGDAGLGQAALGIPSALMSRGPSQTAMACRRGLIYMFGEEGPQRHDSVLLQGGVRFRHVTGQEMVDLEQMLPQVVSDPKFLETHRIKNRNTELSCERLEGVFAVADESRAPRAALGLGQALQLSLLNARGNVYLRDQQDANIRTVYAHQLEFDRAAGVVRVLGAPEQGIEVRVYDENLETGRFNNPVIGREIIIDLETNTVRAKDIRGRVGG